MSLFIFSHPACLKHQVGSDHPEDAKRLHAIFDQLLSSGLEFAVQHRTAPAASDEQLALAHSADYVAHLVKVNPNEGHIWLDDDTAMMPRSLMAARYAAGAAIAAVDTVMQKPNQRAFCAIRPPGHHAEQNKAMGFCLFNNIAVAARHAMKHHGLTRILLVDFDVHHGNGTEDIFKNDSRVMFCSSFEYPFYPAPSLHENAHLLKMPLAAGTDGQLFRQQFRDCWREKIQAFAPQLVLVSAGFDAHAEDEMSHLYWQDADYGWLGEQLKELASGSAHGRIVACLEGGYAHSALGRSVVALLKTWL